MPNIVKSKAALLLILNPMRSAFSRLQSFDLKGLGESKVKEMSETGVKHLKFAVEFGEVQRKTGLHFPFEHPAGASSWSVSSAQRMMRQPRVCTYEGNMCMFNMR